MEIQYSPPDTFTPEARDIAAECANHLAAIEQVVQDASQRLKAGLEHIDRCIAARAEQEKAAQAEDEVERAARAARRSPLPADQLP